MTALPELPPGVPPDRVWLPVEGREGARRALDWLYLLRRELVDPPQEEERDKV